MQLEVESIGFTANEATVYASLLELGEAGGSDIIKRTGLHRNIIYEALDRLTARRLVSRFVNKKTTRFQAANPERLLTEARLRLVAAEEMVEKVKDITPAHTDLIVYEGRDGFQSFWKENVARMQENDTYYVLGSLGDIWSELMEDLLPWYRRQVIKKKIAVKVIAYSENSKDEVLRRDLPGYEVRYVPLGQENPANTLIWRDTVSLQTGVEPYSVVDMHNPALAKAYMNTFMALWEKGNQ